MKVSITYDTEKGISMRGALPTGTFINMTLTALMAAFNQQVNAVPEEDRAGIKEDLYHAFNLAASEFLKRFAPEIDMRPDITEEAILQAENAIVKKRSES